MATNTGFKGINIRQNSGLLLFRAFLQASAGALVTTGTTTLRLYELQSDGTLKTYDFATNTFVVTTPTTPTAAMAYQKSTNGTIDTGLWTYALATTTGFTIAGIYLAHAYNASASATDQLREFQFASAEGDMVLIASGTTGKSYVQTDVQFLAGAAVPLDANNLLKVDAADWNGAAITTAVPTSTYAGGAVASVTGAVGSVTGNVGGNVVGSVASVAGAVASVTGPVTVGTNNDKTGYALSGAGLDPVVAEAGINARQALALVLDATVSILSGAAGTTITIKEPTGTTTRVVATVDASGNRTAVTLSPPA